VADRYVSVPMTSSDPNPSFKVTVWLQVVSKTARIRDKVTIEH